MTHDYLSTACYHAREPGREQLHRYCRCEVGITGPKKPGVCKFCDARCVCPCHYVEEPA